jgi:hypothetical protein
MRRAFPALVAVALVLAAGCLGGGTGPGDADTTDAPATTTAEADQLTPTEPPTTTSDRQRTTKQFPYGTEFVSVDPLANQSRGNVSKDGYVAFGTLTEREQTVFLQALEDGDQTFYPDGDRVNPFGFNDDDRPQFVRYEGTWYYVRVAVV